MNEKPLQRASRSLEPGALPGLVRSREAGLLLMLAVTVAVVTLFNGSFLSPSNVADMLSACAPCVIIGCGVALVVVAGEIDISVGSLYGLLAALMGVLSSPTHAGQPLPVVVAAVLAVGLLVGVVNGVLVAMARVPSIIVTLGMLTILRGVTDVVLGGVWITDLPPDVRELGTAHPLGLSWAVWTAGLVCLVGAWFTTRTPLGRRLFAVGSNPEAARLAGLRVRLIKVVAFGAAGVLTSVAALVAVPQLSVIESGLGIGLELLVVTAVVVGGVSIRGGVGTLAGVALAALLLGIVRSVLVFLKLGSSAVYWERAVYGLFILGAVVVDHLARRRSPADGLSGMHVSSEPLVRAPRVPLPVMLAGALLVTMVGAWLSRPEFVSFTTQLSLLPQVGELALLAVPMTLVMLVGGIDLSVGSAMALAAVTVGIAYDDGQPIWLAALCGVAVGACCGLFNGLFIVSSRLHPLIVTLATLSLFRGLAEGVSGGRPVSGFPVSLTTLATDRILGVPVILAPVAAAYIAAFVLLRRGVAGRNLRAMGFNELACRFTGIRVDRLKLMLYTLSGTCAGLAAVMLIARRNTAKADAGLGIELDVITAVVLGGTSVAGGRGSVVGTLLGVVLLHEVRQFIAWRWQNDVLVLPVVGIVLIASVLLGRAVRGR